MKRRTKASVLWGLVGSLSFLVLVQGYELLATAGIDAGTKLAVAIGVGIGATGLSYVADKRLYDEDSNPDRNPDFDPESDPGDGKGST